MPALSAGNSRALQAVALVLMAGAGASGDSAGMRLGWPGLGTLGAAIAVGWMARRVEASGIAGFLLPLAAGGVALLLPTATPLRLFSGSALLPFAAAFVFSVVVARGLAPPRRALVPFFWALYALVGWQARIRVGPDGDEPQYLMVAESLRRDHDLALDQDFAEQRYSEFYGRKLEPHFRIRGPQGQIYSLHAVGLSVLILPAWALGGFAGVSIFMALLGALLVREIRRLIEAVTGERGLAEGLAWMLGLCPPLIHFAGLVFTEAPAALLLAAGLRAAVFGRPRRGPILAALCAAALPWFNVRYAILSLAIGGSLGLRLFRDSGETRRAANFTRSLVRPALVTALSAVALSVFHYALWGFFDPRRVYGRSREFSLSILPEGLPGLFLDQEFGLLVYAPVYALAAAGGVALWRRQRALAAGAFVACAGVILTASVWPMWRGGFNPPGRFLVPLTPLLAATLALAWPKRPGAALALLSGWSLWCGLAGASRIEDIHRDRDGVAPFFRDQAVAREWTPLWPSFVLPEDVATRALALPWAALLIVAVWRARGDAARPPASGREAAVASGLLMATALLTDVLSPRERSVDRDASRLLGQSSVALHSPAWLDRTGASWDRALVYEPHRFPEGLALAGPVRLPAGTWVLTLETDGAAHGAPSLVSSTHLLPVPLRQAMTPAGSSFQATLRISRSAEYDLRLQGGEPFTLARVRIDPAP